MAGEFLRPPRRSRRLRPRASGAAEGRVRCLPGEALSYFLDTNICIYALKGTYPRIGEHLRECVPSDVKIASIVRAELLLGSMKSTQPKKTRAIVESFLFPFEVVPFDGRAAELYASVRGSLESRGTSIGPNDLVLAATVLASDGVLVTHNVAELRRIKRLRLADWT